ncbi:MAG: AAA family ATPase [Myxococcales bacterium]|nr:AAA family ATPase [Myxococcales bacterium]
MSRLVDEASLPSELSLFDAVEAAYPDELARAREALGRRLPVLVECDKELVPFFFKCLRDRMRADGARLLYLDGRPPAEGPPPPGGVLGMLLAQLRDAVRGAVEQRVVVLPHLDLLATTSGGLTSEAREAIALLYENPNVVCLGFRDPSFPLPDVLVSLFPRRVGMVGIARDRLRHLVTQRESRKLGRGLDVYALYKYVSGVNAVRLRRLLAALDGEDHPEDPSRALAALRGATLAGELSVPTIDLEADIGGYAKVKRRLREEILDVLAIKERTSDPARIARIEQLVPRGMIFWGPPGTGKTLFAKAMASALGAAVLVVSGPELKSRWVGESEENLRRLFLQARQSAPSILVFDEIDSFAAARGTFTGSGVEHSMVNQLLTEMDGFRSNEMVFVVGTTNFVESLDPALLRPGRFEFKLQIPYPDADDRRAILGIYDQKLELALSPAALEYAVRRTGDLVEGEGTRYSGDHLQALGRALARRRLRGAIEGPTEAPEVERALTEMVERPELTAHEERVVATHEAGHAVCALFCEHAPPIERISIQGDLGGSLGAVRFGDPAHRYVVTRAQLRDSICVLFGGREAEALLLDDLSVGSERDLAHATAIARALVEQYGMGPTELGVRRWIEVDAPSELSDDARRGIERAVVALLDAERARARSILEAQRASVEALRDLLIEKKTLDRSALGVFAKVGASAGRA